MHTRVGPTGEQLHQFCPTKNGAAEVDTRGSNFNSKVYVYGPGVALDSGDSYCNDGRIINSVFQGCSSFEQETVFVFQAGKCYDIIVGGNLGGEGDYVLSIDCFNFTDVECGSNISGSTVGLNGGVQRHRLCSREMTRVEVNTCGSNFPTDLQLNVSSVMLSSGCADCPNDPNARPGRCYEISVGGTELAEGNYSLSVQCTAALPVGCGTNVTGSTVGLPRDSQYPLREGAQIHSFCPNATELAEVSTCGSNFNTWLEISSPDFASDSDNTDFENADLNCGEQEVVGFDIEAGECYGIIVGGNSEEGTYSLSIDCGTRSAPRDVQCGSIVSGSTAGLFQRIQPYLFCSNQTARVEASTCGSNFPTEVSMVNEMPILDRDCADCSGDPNAACIGFNVRCRAGRGMGSWVTIARHVFKS
eukprot:s2794_g14.t1